METSKNQSFLMYFHSAFRNVGLFTTLSYASLGYSRVYRGKSFNYDVLLILVSISFLIIAALINYFLYNDFRTYIHKNKLENDNIANYKNVMYSVFGIHGILLVLALITGIRSLSST